MHTNIPVDMRIELIKRHIADQRSEPDDFSKLGDIIGRMMQKGREEAEQRVIERKAKEEAEKIKSVFSGAF